ncbi:DltD N-terminal domain protein [Thozetella sp. PMI_491]|nr:DltD N-terminal domain protein [Thozetella sp. PMI_491]
MPRTDVEFKASDGTVLRGWFYTPESPPPADGLPCLVMSHGFSALKEMGLDLFAEFFSSKLPVACLAYDNRGFGASDAGPDGVRQEIIPPAQMADISDAITYAQSRPDVNAARIAIWGSSYSGGHVLQVGATDRRVKVVLSQGPCVNGPANFRRLVRGDFAAGMDKMFEQDRLARAAGTAPIVLPVVDENPHNPSALPTPDSYVFFSGWSEKSSWKNEVTLRSIEAFRAHNPSAYVEHISPTPLLMTVAQEDVLTPTDLALEAYSRAREPKELQLLPGGHFDQFGGPNFERNAGTQAEFLKKYLLA